MHVGDYTLEDTITVPFTTRAFATGAPTDFDEGTPVIEVYEDDSVTQITTAETLTPSFDTVVGLNMVSVAATAANGFESGKSYTLVISTGTVDSVSVVGEVVGHFTIERGAAAVDLANGTDGLGAIKTDTAAILVDTGTNGVLLAATATSAQLVDDTWDEVLTGGTHNVVNSAGRRLRQIQEAGGYSNGMIYIDTVNGTAGTTDFENGVDSNPVDTIADANTLAASLGIATFHIASGSTVTLAAAQNNQAFLGENWTLALGGQDIAGSVFTGATVSGIAAGTGTTQIFEHCMMNAGSHIKGTHLLTCGIAGTQTVVEAGDYFFDRCHSAVAGTSTWIFEFGDAIGNTNLNVRNYSGGIQLESMGDTGTDTASIEGQGQVIEGTCTGGTVAIRGAFTVSGITNLTLSDEARLDMPQINAEVDTGISDAGLATAAALATVDGIVDDILADTAVIGAAGAGLTAVPWNSDWDYQVESEVTDALNLYDAPTKAELDTLIGTPADTDIATDLANIQTDTTAIVADTNELQTDWANGGRLDLLIDAIKLETDKLDSAHSEVSGVPAANETPLDKIGYLFMALRNRVDATAAKKTFYDNGDAAEWEKDVSDDGTTYTESKGNAI